MADRFLDDYIPYLLQRTDQLLSARFHRSLRERRVEPSDWRVLAVLAADGPLTVGTLTDRALHPQPTTTHAVARLERRGDVRRFAGTQDGRQRFVELTEQGRRRAAELIDAARADAAMSMSEAGITLAPEFVEHLVSMMRQLDRWDRMD